MPRVRTYLRALLLGASFFVVACSDLPTAPQTEAVEEVAPNYGLLGGLLGVVVGTVDTLVDVVVGVLSPVLTRDEPLLRDEVVSEWIGRSGGVIRLPRAGLTVVVPRGALDRYTRITVTAPAGDLLGYEFAPHGLAFNRPVTLRQEVSSSQTNGGLQAIYFDGDLLPEVTVLEVLPVATTRTEATFLIDHFSGYAFRRSGYVIATN
jgi:hypothetical protein